MDLQIIQLVLCLITATNWTILLVLYCLYREFRNPPGSLIAGDIASTLINVITAMYLLIQGRMK